MLTPLEITDLAPGLAAGSLDFSYTWDAAAPAGPVTGRFLPVSHPQYIDAGAATLQIVTPNLRRSFSASADWPVLPPFGVSANSKFQETDQGEIRR